MGKRNRQLAYEEHRILGQHIKTALNSLEGAATVVAPAGAKAMDKFLKLRNKLEVLKLEFEGELFVHYSDRGGVTPEYSDISNIYTRKGG